MGQTEHVVYTKRMVAGWGDMDFNAHMRNTAYLDKAADIRMMFFAEHGFPVAEFSRLRIGPVVMRDELDYKREVALLQEVDVTLAVAGLSDDVSRFIMRNEFFRLDGSLCARVTSSGGWLDLQARTLVAPPEALAAVMRLMPRTDDFVSLPSSARPRA